MLKCSPSCKRSLKCKLRNTLWSNEKNTIGIRFILQIHPVRKSLEFFMCVACQNVTKNMLRGKKGPNLDRWSKNSMKHTQLGVCERERESSLFTVNMTLRNSDKIGGIRDKRRRKPAKKESWSPGCSEQKH